MPELVRASHIKPWSDCRTDDERLDVFSGHLLAPHIDAPFDSGLMTVADDGRGQLSSRLGGEPHASLDVDRALWLTDLRPQHRKYLDYHRRVVWRP